MSALEPIGRASTDVGEQAGHAPEASRLFESDLQAAQRADTARPSLGYRAKAPITEMHTVQDRHGEASRLQHGIAAFSGDRAGNPVEVPSLKNRSPLDPRRVPDKREHKDWKAKNEAWEARTTDAHGVAGNITHSARSDGAFSYRLGSQPVAMMKLGDREDHTEVTWLSTHPGVAGGGQTMIEKAANVSQQGGHGGNLHLTPRDEASAGFYKSVGFKGDQSGMQLDPSKSTKWQQRDDSWELKANEGKGYLADAPEQ